MNDYDVKYSIMIPVRNGVKYLPTCIDTIITQNFENYELIISDDHSNDGTDKFLCTIKNNHVKIVRPPYSQSMAEHWEWVLTHAKGEWLIYVGQDDGLQPYFFRLAEKLTEIAKKKDIRAITSERAYFFWPGCQSFYGDIAVNYNATSKIKILNSKLHAFQALAGYITYFELPQMYTTSLFHRSLVEEAKEKQNGRLFVTHPQDANLTAIACSLEKRFIKSLIPLGWVGSSPKSAGLAVIADVDSIRKDKNDDEILNLKKEYLEKTKVSKLPYHPLIGEFSIGSCVLYFWGALLFTSSLRNEKVNKILNSKLLKSIIFASVILELDQLNSTDVINRKRLCQKLINDNKCKMIWVKFWVKILAVSYKIYKINKTLKKKIYKYLVSLIEISINWGKNPEITMIDAAKIVSESISQYKLIEKMK